MVKALILLFFAAVCLAEDPVPEEVKPFDWPQTIPVAIDDLHYDVAGNLLYIKHDMIFVESKDWAKIRPLTQADEFEYTHTGHITLTRIITDGVV